MFANTKAKTRTIIYDYRDATLQLCVFEEAE